MTIPLVIGVNPLQTTLFELGIVSGRVALLLRSAEIHPVFVRFVLCESNLASSPNLCPLKGPGRPLIGTSWLNLCKCHSRPNPETVGPKPETVGPKPIIVGQKPTADYSRPKAGSQKHSRPKAGRSRPETVGRLLKALGRFADFLALQGGLRSNRSTSSNHSGY